VTYQNDPNRPRRPITDNMTESTDNTTESYTAWIIGGIAALVLIAGLFFMFGRTNPNTASNTINRPAATAPTTTGSGASSGGIPNNPNGTAPQRDANQPAPAPRSATPVPTSPTPAR
jgi:hypothetical protein